MREPGRARVSEREMVKCVQRVQLCQCACKTGRAKRGPDKQSQQESHNYLGREGETGLTGLLPGEDGQDGRLGEGGLASFPYQMARQSVKYTVRIELQAPQYKALVLYFGAAGCVRHVPVQYHTIIAAEPPRATQGHLLHAW